MSEGAYDAPPEMLDDANVLELPPSKESSKSDPKFVVQKHAVQ
jgi:hypothetical protein